MNYFETQDWLNTLDHFDEKLTRICDSLEVIAGSLSRADSARRTQASENVDMHRDREKDKILSAFQAYVEQDAEAAENSYVKDTLMGQCGLNASDMKKYGFGWLLDDEEDASAEASAKAALSSDVIS